MLQTLTFYHGTVSDTADKILKKGLDSHNWVTTSYKEAKTFARQKFYERLINGTADNIKPVVLKFINNVDSRRLLIHSPVSNGNGKNYIVTNYIYGAGWQKRLIPIYIVNKSIAVEID